MTASRCTLSRTTTCGLGGWSVSKASRDHQIGPTPQAWPSSIGQSFTCPTCRGRSLRAPPARQAGFGSTIAVPLLRDDQAVGALAVSRQATGGFSDRQIALLQTFAGQAVIAIGNVRLFTELQETNRELTQAHAQ
ncbi:MAG: GAF domain-containing protein, partial [Candidatus Rokuibacteriota bacterium]